MAYPKTKDPIRPKKVKKRLLLKAWSRGASARWKSEYHQKLDFKRNGIM